MSDMIDRLTKVLEPILHEPDPRRQLSAYHDMPYALFRYDPPDEFELRRQVTQLETRLQNRGKRVRRIYLSECLSEAMLSQRSLDEWIAIEREQGTESTVETVHAVLSSYCRSPIWSLPRCRPTPTRCATSCSSCVRARCFRSTGRSRCSSR